MMLLAKHCNGIHANLAEADGESWPSAWAEEVLSFKSTCYSRTIMISYKTRYPNSLLHLINRGRFNFKHPRDLPQRSHLRRAHFRAAALLPRRFRDVPSDEHQVPQKRLLLPAVRLLVQNFRYFLGVVHREMVTLVLRNPGTLKALLKCTLK